MAVNVYNSITAAWDDTHAAQMFADQGTLGAPSGVPSGLAVSYGTGDRTLSISAGRALLAGTSLVNDAATTIQLAATGSGSKTWQICAQTDWAAARTAFTNAGGASNLAAASTAAQAAAGSFVAVPLGTTLARTPGTLWQEPLAQQVVAAGVGTLSSGLTDVRYTGAVVSQALTWAGNFTQGSPPLTVHRDGPRAFLDGQFQLSSGSSIPLGQSAINTVIVPEGFRPVAKAWVSVTTGAKTSSRLTHDLFIDVDGSAQLWPGDGPIPQPSTIRVHNASWLIGA